MGVDEIIDKALNGWAQNYAIAKSDSERARTDMYTKGFLDTAGLNTDEIERYNRRYEQLKEEYSI